MTDAIERAFNWVCLVGGLACFALLMGLWMERLERRELERAEKLQREQDERNRK